MIGTKAQETNTEGLKPVELKDFQGLEVHALIARYRMGIEHFDRRLFEAPDAVLDRWFDPSEGVGAMSCRALMVHLYDAELVWQHRMRRVLAEDGPVFQDFDHEAFIESGLSGPGRRPVPGHGGLGSAGLAADGGAIGHPVGALAAAVHTLRQVMAAVLYQLGPAGWARGGMHPARGALDFRQMVEINAWHTAYHAAFINAKLERLIGPAPASEACAHDAAKQAGGCGPGCGCAGSGGAGSAGAGSVGGG